MEKVLQKLQSIMKSGIKNKDLHEKVLLFAPLLQRVFSPSHTRKKKLQSRQDGLTGFDPAPHQRTSCLAAGIFCLLHQMDFCLRCKAEMKTLKQPICDKIATIQTPL